VRNRDSNKGNALLIVVGASLVIGLGIWSIQSLMPSLFQQTIRTADLLAYRLALNSAVDYAAYSIQERRCVTDTWVQTAENCDPSHNGSLERLIMSEMAFEHANLARAKASPPKPPFTPFPGDEYRREVPLSRITSAHPLYLAIQGLPKDSVNSITLSAKRIRSIQAPSSDGRIMISIRAELNMESRALRKIVRSSTLYTEALFGFFPRELGSMALVVANDLILNERTTPDYGIANNRGNFYLPYITAAQKDQKRGINFRSPIFVNGSIVGLNDDQVNSQQLYSPVTFSSKVYLGNGTFKKGSQDFTPTPAKSGRMQLLSSLKSMGGFKSGLIIDGRRDEGLDVLSGRMNGSYDDALMQRCLARNNVLSDLTRSIRSSLLVRRNGSLSNNGKGGTDVAYSIALSGQRDNGVDYFNEFVPQNASTGVLSQSNVGWPTTTNRGIEYSGPSGAKPVAKITIQMGPASAPTSAEFNMAADSTLKLRPDMTAVIQSLQNAVNDAQSQLNAANKRINDAKNSVDSYKTERNTLVNSTIPSAKESYQQKRSEAWKEYYRNTVPVPILAPVSDLDAMISNRTIEDLNESDAANKTGFQTKKGSYATAKTQLTTLRDRLNELNSQIALAENASNPSSPLQQDKVAKENALQATQALLAAATTADPGIDIALDSTMRNGDNGTPVAQPNQLELKISTRGDTYLPNEIAIKIEAYDVAYRLCQNGNQPCSTRDHPNPATNIKDNLHFRDGEIKLIKNTSGTYQDENWMSNVNWKAAHPTTRNSSAAQWVPLADGFNYGELVTKCSATTAGTALAFGVADWDESFAEATRKSWNFADPSQASNTFWNPNSGTLEITNAMANTFHVRSIIGTCHIKADTTFVAGFFTCDKLTIAPRTTPLTIVGSFIVSSSSIDPSVYDAGIDWYSIYHPQAVEILRARRILSPTINPGLSGNTAQSGPIITGTCDMPSDPIWNPYPSLNALSRVFRCNPAALRQKADNWTWTLVDPNQGLRSGDATMSRKERVYRLLIREFSRSTNL
jgi:uncharacterized protein YlxW (UPF0749 family)